METCRFRRGQTFLLLSFIISTALRVISGTHESQPFLLVNEQGVFPELPGTPHLLNPSVNSAPLCSPPLTYLLLRDLCASACVHVCVYCVHLILCITGMQVPPEMRGIIRSQETEIIDSCEPPDVSSGN